MRTVDVAVIGAGQAGPGPVWPTVGAAVDGTRHLNLRVGYPEEAPGVSAYPGVYFIGLQLMHTRKSGLIFGVGEDAQHVAASVAQHLGGAPRATPAGHGRSL